MNKLKIQTGLRIGGVLILFASLLAAIFATANRPVSGQAQVLFIQTQNDADCALLLSGDQCVMVDTGEAVDGPHIVEQMRQRGITDIDCLILTHPDKDHIGGAPALAEEFPIHMVVEPYFGTEKESLDQLHRLFDELGIPYTQPYRDRLMNYGEWSLRLMAPKQRTYKKDNNYSLALQANHGDVTVFFGGDAEKERSSELLSSVLPQDVFLYKVPYHGRSTPLADELIQKLSPQYAIVTASAPSVSVRKSLQAVGATVFCTVGTEASELLFISDGRELRLGE